MSQSANSSKRGADESSKSLPARKRLRGIHDDSGSTTKPLLLDLYMAGRTNAKERMDGEQSFMMILQQKPIKDVCWMRKSSEDTDSGKYAYILFHNGKLHSWGKEQVHWNDVSHFHRKISKTPFLEQVSQVACGAHYAGVDMGTKRFWTTRTTGHFSQRKSWTWAC